MISNAPFDDPRFPYCSYEDNVCVFRFLTILRLFPIDKYYVRRGSESRCRGSRNQERSCVVGYSMGGQHLDRYCDWNTFHRLTTGQSCTRVSSRESLPLALPHERAYITDNFARYSTVESFFIEQSESYWLQFWNANDLLTRLDTWQRGDLQETR